MTEIEKFKASVQLCNERDVLLEECRQYSTLASYEFDTLEHYKENYYDEHAPKTFFTILSFLAVYFLTAKWVMAFFESLEWHNFFQMGSAILTFGILTLAVYCLVFKKLFYMLCSDDFQKYADAAKEYSEILPEILSLRDDAKSRLERHETFMEKDENCIIPRKYWHVANELLVLIQNKRATDIVSAINKYEDIQHQIRMEGMAAQSVAYNEMAMYAAEQAKINSETAARKAGEAAFVSKLNLAYTFLNDNDN